MRCVLLRVAAFVACATSLGSVFSGTVFASRDFNGNCGSSGCHTVTTGREATTPTPITAQPGDTITFTTSVAGPGGTEYVVFSGKPVAGLDGATQSLTAVTGTANASHILAVAPSVPAQGWVLQTGDPGTNATYYTSARLTATSFTKDFTFVIPAGTPADTYTLRMGVGGNSGSPAPWTESTLISLTVGAAPEPATLVMLFGGALVGFVCWRGRKQLAAK
jgi:hypothetical protein